MHRHPMLASALLALAASASASASAAAAAGALHARELLYTRTAGEFRTRNTTSHIVEMSAAIIVPPVPSGPRQNVSSLFVYPTLGADGADNVLQNGLLIVSDPKEFCNGTKEQWCALSKAGGSPMRKCGPPNTQSCSVDPSRNATALAYHDPVAVSVNDVVTWHMTYDEASKNSTTTMTVNGRTAGRYSAPVGRSVYFSIGMDAKQEFSGLVGTFTFFNVTLALAEADPQFGRDPIIPTLEAEGNPPSAVGELTTQDGGKTWTAGSIMLNKVDIPPEQRVAA